MKIRFGKSGKGSVSSKVSLPEGRGTEKEWLWSGGIAPTQQSNEGAFSEERIQSDLQCFALGLSSVVYQYSLEGLGRILEKEGMTHFKGFNPSWSSESFGDPWDNSKIGLGFVRDRRAWVVFRGSDDALDWDANFRLSKMKDGAHRGFTMCWEKLAPLVSDWLELIRENIDELIITGHSLGGAIAVLAAQDMASNKRIPVRAVFTFGAPRVGSAKFVKAYDELECGSVKRDGSLASLGEVTIQLRDPNDIVPKVPLKVLGYRHCGTSDQRPSSLIPTIGTSGVDPNFSPSSSTPSFLDGIADFLNSIFPFVKPLFSGVEKLSYSGLSHRMKNYQEYFGFETSFHRAISRELEIIESIQKEKDEENLILNYSSVPYVDNFEKEKTKAWTPRLSLVVLLAVILLLSFYGVLLGLLQFWIPELRWYGYGFIIIMTVILAGKIRSAL